MKEAIGGGDLIGYSGLNGELHMELRWLARHATANRILALLNSQVIRLRRRAERGDRVARPAGSLVR